MGSQTRNDKPRTKRAICRLASITVQAPDYGRTMSAGCEVDLLERVGPGLTLEDALGAYVTGFELLDEQ